MRGEIFRDDEKLWDVQFYGALTVDENKSIVARKGMVFGPQDALPSEFFVCIDPSHPLDPGEYELRFRRSQNIMHCYLISLKNSLPTLFKGMKYVPASVTKKLSNRSGSQRKAECIAGVEPIARIGPKKRCYKVPKLGQ